MPRAFSLRKKMAFAGVSLTLFVLCNQIFALLFGYPGGWQWGNPLMRLYPVGKFDPAGGHRVAVHYRNDQQLGYRLEPEVVIPPTGPLVLHFGDSSTWGWGLGDRRDAYPTVLQSWLPIGAHSVNLGVPGYSSLQVRRYIEAILPKLRGRVIGLTVYAGNNDATVEGTTDQDRLEGAWTGLMTWVQRILPFCYWFGEQAKQLAPVSSQPRVSPEEYAENLRQIMTVARSYRIPVVMIVPLIPLAWPPAHWQQWPRPLSLFPDVRHSWVRRELVDAQVAYQAGLALANQPDGRSLALLQQALDHDWVLPRMKSPWRDSVGQLARVANGSEAQFLDLPNPTLEAEYGSFWFADYCHPAARLHHQIASGLADCLGYLR